ncbi:FKBP-type peptidyl-prolyl cis-trans isomerase [Chitinophaga lutea]|uniref:Peptidyl-prolyl cis-trans isomerase n=1 Tax=Chitinophaga lutea TaxID=2488634 RepID=A0A3N4PNM3_9BACT|nr:FKBP-type peptidyl-prolyl cis-trans isomerase [Chitinophaga lutea]RPE09405.1 FKBP-type peptidyl-prolyl cis-trans isomerase [Chitinophaga lutea]
MIRKCLFIGALSVLTAQAAFSQKKQTAAPKPLLRTQLDSVSYTIGNDLGQMLKGQGLDSLNLKLLFKAIEDHYTGKTPVLSADQGTTLVRDYILNKNKVEGEKFLAKNKTKPGVVTLPSGLQYQVLKTGTGPKPTLNDKVKVHYHGMLIDGTTFDSSIDRGEPITLPVTGVIKGWTEALLLMPVGSKWKLFIPSQLAYGERAAGPKIKPNSALVFDVELLSIEAATPAETQPAAPVKE